MGSPRIVPRRPLSEPSTLGHAVLSRADRWSAHTQRPAAQRASTRCCGASTCWGSRSTFSTPARRTAADKGESDARGDGGCYTHADGVAGDESRRPGRRFRAASARPRTPSGTVWSCFGGSGAATGRQNMPDGPQSLGGRLRTAADRQPQREGPMRPEILRKRPQTIVYVPDEPRAAPHGAQQPRRGRRRPLGDAHGSPRAPWRRNPRRLERMGRQSLRQWPITRVFWCVRAVKRRPATRLAPIRTFELTRRPS